MTQIDHTFSSFPFLLADDPLPLLSPPPCVPVQRHAVRVGQSGPLLPMLWESGTVVRDFPDAQAGDSYKLKYEPGTPCTLFFLASYLAKRD